MRYWPPAIVERAALEARAGSTRIALIAEPATVTRILLNRGDQFPRARLHDRILGAAYGENLIRGDRLDWRRQRKEIAQPLTTAYSLEMAPRMRRACMRIMDEWAAAGPDAPIDLLRDARRFALDSLWRCFFASESEAAGGPDPVVEAAALTIDAHRTGTLVEHLADLRPLARRALDRGYAGRGPADLGDARDEAADFNTMLLFLHAGHDNVTATLGWALWLLAHHPEIQQQVREEARAAGSDAGPGAAPLANALILETLRLYPPIMHLIRDVTVDLEVAGATIGAGFTAVLSMYAMHRNRLWWPAPDSFRPERFLGKAGEQARRTMLLPFGAGPRGCIGASFALVELVLAVRLIVARFALAPVPGRALDCRVDWVLRPEGEAPLLARPLA
ncbi:MAG: cytochrome P450 [Sphingomonadaceae bacterium]|nr:cytochrome P450 [Sphingomonadaceae bacterium]